MAKVNNLHSASSLPTCDTATPPLSPTGEETITQKSALINQLPIEILKIIFIHCAFRYYHEHVHHPTGPTPRVPSWVNVSYVSRHWRNVALNCPTLWTYLFATSPRWTDELLARSKQASLKLPLTWNLWDTAYPELRFVEGVLNHVERIQELRLHLSVADSEHESLSKLSSRAPRLQNLEIFADDVVGGWEWPSVPFDGDTPALRTLVLVNCPVRWYSLNLSGLTTLSLRCAPVQLQQNSAEFLATLSCMQDLTHLYLDRSLASAAGFISSVAFPTFQKIKLPHLSRLLMIAPLSTVVALLSCVNIPSKTQVRLQCHAEHGFSLDGYALLCSSLTQRFNIFENRAPSSLTIRSLVINLAPGMVGLAFSELDRDCDFTPSIWEWRCNIPLQVVVYDEVTASDENHIISDICCSIPWTNVQTVRVVNPPLSSTFWSKTLGHFQELRYLKLSCGYMPDLTAVLSVIPHPGHAEKKGGHADQGPYRVLAPVLEELELCDIIFSSAADVRSLYDALSTRKGSRGQLRMIRGHVGRYDSAPELGMIGSWEGGHFHVVEEC